MRHSAALVLALAAASGHAAVPAPERALTDPKAVASASEPTARPIPIAEAHYYEDEGHGFVKRENQIDALERSVKFLEQHLK